MIITIDGPAAAGKGTISAELSQKYQLAYFDTGMIYRAVGLQMVLDNQNLDNENAATDIAHNLTFPQMIELSHHKDFRSDLGSQAASIVSAQPKVRAALLAMQQNFAHNPVFANGEKANGVVYDGRDTGTVVCPNADIKFFITASTEVRAKRRYDEFVAKNMDITYEQVLEDMISRDNRDAKRASAPMKPADDAFIIDTSAMDIKTVLNKIFAIIDTKI